MVPKQSLKGTRATGEVAGSRSREEIYQSGFKHPAMPKARERSKTAGGSCQRDARRSERQGSYRMKSGNPEDRNALKSTAFGDT
jgi:hypothetical protein